ncbi:MAG: hypothetical protein HY901_09610 [Deltaproteobacteria bacterium]|nr:hypothetical protein [Deltaproteobacteria bacterium]
MSFALLTLVAMLGVGGAQERVYVPEGWYQLEDGYGETEDGMALVIILDEPSAGVVEAQYPPALPTQPPIDLSEEVARFQQRDCEEVRGRYLERILELHGVDTFSLDPRALAAWTHQRPPPSCGYFLNGSLGDPALAPLWGEPPVPPGPLSFDLELQTLARDLLYCQQPSPAPAQ